MRGDWPLCRFSFTENGLQVSLVLFETLEVPWESVVSINGIFTGIVVQFRHQEEQRELLLYSPFLWRRFESSVTRHGLEISKLIAKTPQ